MTRVESLAAIRSIMASLDTLAAWNDGQPPAPEQIYTPVSHGRVLDLERTLVVGNRGVGKTFWSNALVDDLARSTVAEAYPKIGLSEISNAVFGFRGGLADALTPDKTVLRQAIENGIRPETLWFAVALRAFGGESMSGLPSDLSSLAAFVTDRVEEAHLRFRNAAKQRADNGTRLLLVFDALDRLGDSWEEMRPLTVGLFKFALSVRGMKGLSLKIFVRPDQLADPAIHQFPDASKLVAERVDLRWRASDLFGLVFFHLWRDRNAKHALQDACGLNDDALPAPLRYAEPVQRSLFNKLAGEWMGANNKRGATFTWLPQHLADARDETSPRSFLRALSVAATHTPNSPELAIDHQGIKQGVIAASQVRVNELTEDYWWMSRALKPLRNITVPCEHQIIHEKWMEDGTCQAIRSSSGKGSLLPIFFESRDLINSDEEALLQTLEAIAVIEFRTSGKINFPDIFRVGAGIKRRGGVKPPSKPT